MTQLQKIGFDLSDGSRCQILIDGTLRDDSQRREHLEEIKRKMDVILDVNKAEVSSEFPEDHKQIDVREFINSLE